LSPLAYRVRLEEKRSPEEPVEKIAGYFRPLPVTAGYRPKFQVARIADLGEGLPKKIRSHESGLPRNASIDSGLSNDAVVACIPKGNVFRIFNNL
jgi:hypothetical protein